MYRRALTVWFEIRGLWPQPVVKYALLDIENSDPEYYELLLRLSNNSTSPQEKSNAAAEIYDLLFTE